MTSTQFPRRARQLAGGELTPAQFWALAQLMRMPEPSRSAAEGVLVRGDRPTDAAAASGLSVPSVSRSVARVRRAHALIVGAYG